MKKLIALTLALLLALSLAACGGNSGKSPSGGKATPPASQGGAANNAPAGNTPDVDMGSIVGSTVKPSDYDPATRQAMINAARAEGGDLEFRPDGSMVVTDSDGTVIIQNADGTWTYQDEDGNTTNAQIGGDWPDNEFTRLIPKPEFAVSVGMSNESNFAATFADATQEQIKAYAEQIKAAGFDVDPETEEVEMQGVAIYSYSAQNAAGYRISVFSMAGTMGLTMEKP